MRISNKLIAIGSLILALIIVGVFLSINILTVKVQASSNFVALKTNQSVLSDAQIKEAALDTYSGSTISEKSTNQFEVSYAGTGSKITIGDSSPSKSANFKPDLTISQWNGEAEFKLIAPVDVNSKEQLSTSLGGWANWFGIREIVYGSIGIIVWIALFAVIVISLANLL